MQYKQPIIFITHEQRQAAKRILCAMLQKSNGTFQGQTRLYKAFYWAHLFYWKQFTGVLTVYPIARMPNGPGIDQGEDLLFEMQCEGLIRVRKGDASVFAERTFELLVNFDVNLTDEETRAVEYGLGQVEGKTGKQVSDESHAQSRSWRRLANGRIMDIYEDLLTEEEVAGIDAASRETASLIDVLNL